MGSKLGRVKQVASGKRFEESLDRYHVVLARRKLLDLDRGHPRFVLVNGKWIHAAGSSPVDYQGLARVAELGTLPVAFDAKVLPVNRWTYEYPVKQRHQAASLARKADLGGVAFVLCEAREPAPGYALLVGGAPTLWALARGERLRLADLSAAPDGPRGWLYPTVQYRTGMGYPWLEGVADLLEGRFPAARTGPRRGSE